MPSMIEILLIINSIYMLFVVAYVNVKGGIATFCFKFLPLALAVLTGLIAALSILNVI